MNKKKNKIINKKLIFIQSTFGDAHQMIRYLELSKYYLESELLAFERPYYETVKNIDFISLGKINHREFLKRFYLYIKAIFLIKKSKSKTLENDVFFYGFDFLSILVFSRKFIKSKLIFEIPDIREIYFINNLVSKLFIKILKLSIERLSIVIVTSDLFITGFLNKNNIKLEKYFLIENKVHFLDRTGIINKEKDSLITIGFFGLIRCERSLKILIEFLNSTSEYNLIIYGYFMGISEGVIKEIKSHSKIKYKGTYKSPDDLSKLYSEIDISWIAYPFSLKLEGNFKYARTNRFYEAGFFKIPMIANIQSGDAHYVNKYNIGININFSDINIAIDKLKMINAKEISIWKKEIEKINVRAFQATEDDYDLLLNHLKIVE